MAKSIKAKRSKRRKISQKQHKKYFNGGIGDIAEIEQQYPTTIFTQFPITDENIVGFNRHIASPMDCFINALQIIGLLDNLTANVMRISSSGRTGFAKEEIESIFLLWKGTNFDFKNDTDYNRFSRTIFENLQPGHVCFCGYSVTVTNESFSHVFLIGRYANGTLVYIDPQIPTICDLNTQECQNLIQNKSLYYILYNSTDVLTTDIIQQLGFTI